MESRCFKCGEVTSKYKMHKSIGVLCTKCYNRYINKYKNVNVYRFISPNAFIKILENKGFVFSLPSIWEDSFEDIYFKIFEKTYKVKFEDQDKMLIDPIFAREVLSKRDEYYCQCWTLTQESEFFWLKYGCNNSAIRLEINLADAFNLGTIIEPVKYCDIPSITTYKRRKEVREWDKVYKSTPNHLKYRVDEEGCYHGNPLFKSVERKYLEMIMSFMHDYKREFQFELLPITKFLSTKQIKYAEENEVRLFIKNDFLTNRNNTDEKVSYLARLFSKRHSNNICIQTKYNRTQEVKLDKDLRIIKSIMFHPDMPEEMYRQLYNKIRIYNLQDVFKGRSKIFESPFA